MYGLTVRVDGKEYFVFCTPDDPHSEVLRLAARMAEKEEQEAKRQSAQTYYDALRTI